MRSFSNYRETFTTFTPTAMTAHYVSFRERCERRERFYRTHGNSQELRNAIYGGKRFTTFTTFTERHNVLEGRSCSSR